MDGFLRFLAIEHIFAGGQLLGSDLQQLLKDEDMEEIHIQVFQSRGQCRGRFIQEASIFQGKKKILGGLTQQHSQGPSLIGPGGEFPQKFIPDHPFVLGIESEGFDGKVGAKFFP